MRASWIASRYRLARSLAWASLCVCLLGTQQAHGAPGLAGGRQAQDAPDVQTPPPSREDDPAPQPPAVTVPSHPDPLRPPTVGAPSPSAVPDPAPAQSMEAPLSLPMSAPAKTHYDRGLALYAERNFQAAAAELRRGFLVEPRREFVFAEAQAWRLAGDCGRALTLYQMFLDSRPPPLQIEAAHLGIDRCGPGRATRSTANVGAAPQLAQTPTQPPPVLTAWWRDPWGAAAVGAGVVALGTGIGFAVASNRARDQAEQATAAQTSTYADFARLWDTARQRRAVAVTSILGGVVLLGVGATRFFIVHRRETGRATHARGESSDSGMSLALVGGGASVLWQGAF